MTRRLIVNTRSKYGLQVLHQAAVKPNHEEYPKTLVTEKHTTYATLFHARQPEREIPDSAAFTGLLFSICYANGAGNLCAQISTSLLCRSGFACVGRFSRKACPLVSLLPSPPFFLLQNALARLRVPPQAHHHSAALYNSPIWTKTHCSRRERPAFGSS